MGPPWAPSQQAPQQARAHIRPAIQPHQWTHEPAHSQGTSAGRSTFSCRCVNNPAFVLHAVVTNAADLPTGGVRPASPADSLGLSVLAHSDM